jgi:hypothetical protein
MGPVARATILKESTTIFEDLGGSDDARNRSHFAVAAT